MSAKRDLNAVCGAVNDALIRRGVAASARAGIAAALGTDEGFASDGDPVAFLHALGDPVIAAANDYAKHDAERAASGDEELTLTAGEIASVRRHLLRLQRKKDAAPDPAVQP